MADAAQSAGASRLIATAPAVGYFRPRANLRAGTKVRAGDRIGSVDVLGIGQDVVAPGDGLIGATLVGPGEPVEYGQGIIVLEQIGEPRAQGASGTAPGTVAIESVGAARGSAGGAAEQAAAESGAAFPVTGEPGPANSGPVDPGPADSGPAESGPADPVTVPSGPVDPGPADVVPAGDEVDTAVAAIRPGGQDDSDGSSPAVIA